MKKNALLAKNFFFARIFAELFPLFPVRLGDFSWKVYNYRGPVILMALSPRGLS